MEGFTSFKYFLFMQYKINIQLTKCLQNDFKLIVLKLDGKFIRFNFDCRFLNQLSPLASHTWNYSAINFATNDYF